MPSSKTSKTNVDILSVGYCLSQFFALTKTTKKYNPWQDNSHLEFHLNAQYMQWWTSLGSEQKAADKDIRLGSAFKFNSFCCVRISPFHFVIPPPLKGFSSNPLMERLEWAKGDNK